MNVHRIHEEYWLSGGAIRSLNLSIQNNTAEIELSVERIIEKNKNGMITLMKPCTLKLKFHELIEISLFDKFPSLGYYLNSSILGENDKEAGLSFNVHDNSSQTHEQDNWLIKAKKLTWEEV